MSFNQRAIPYPDRPRKVWGSFSVRMHHPRAEGFSLVEVMVVVVIIGLLAGVVAISAPHFLSRGKQNTARTEIATLSSAVEEFYSIHGRYPTNEEGLQVLRERSESVPEPLITQDPIDPWGRPYQYNSPGRDAAYEIVCLGGDGREGGDGADGDISSLNLKQRQGGP